MNKTIPVTCSSMPGFEEYINEIKDMWNSHWLTNMGVKHRKLEVSLKKYLNAPNIILFSNGHLALEAAIEAFNLSGQIITTPFTFASTTHAIVRNGLEPVFCDINHDDYTIDADKIEDHITEKTTAIVPVHVYGNICNYEKIDSLASKYNLKVIYDAAHAFGVKINNASVSNLGNASMFSFHATKIFNSIEGGAVTFEDDSLINTLNGIKNFGITGLESVEYVGGNAKMNEFQAAMGICNLRHIDKYIQKSKIVFERYLERLEGNRGIKLRKPQNGVYSNYSYFPVLFDNYWLHRDQVYEILKENNIYSRKYFYPLTSDFVCYRDRFNSSDTPVAKYVADRILTLPLYGELSLEEVDRICNIIIGKRCLCN